MVACGRTALAGGRLAADVDRPHGAGVRCLRTGAGPASLVLGELVADGRVDAVHGRVPSCGLAVVVGRWSSWRSPGPAAGPASDLGVMGVAEVARTPALAGPWRARGRRRGAGEHGCPSRCAAAHRACGMVWHGVGRDGAAGKQVGDRSTASREAQAASARTHAGGREVGAASDGLGHAARVDHRGHLLPGRRDVAVMMTIEPRANTRRFRVTSRPTSARVPWTARERAASNPPAGHGDRRRRRRAGDRRLPRRRARRDVRHAGVRLRRGAPAGPVPRGRRRVRAPARGLRHQGVPLPGDGPPGLRRGDDARRRQRRRAARGPRGRRAGGRVHDARQQQERSPSC